MTMAPTMDNHDTVYALASHAQTLYAGRTSGLLRSRDAGGTWVDALTRLEHARPLTCTAVAAQGEMVFAGVKGGVLRSTDSGETWTIVGLASPPPDVVALGISPNFAADGVVAAGTTDDGVFLSADRGETWTAWNFGLIDSHVYALAFSPAYAQDRTLIAGTESGIFISKNGGRGWAEVEFPVKAAPVISLAFSAAYGRDGVIFAGTESNGLYVSADHGSSWNKVEDSLVQGGINTILVTEPESAAVYLLLEDKVVLSRDNAKSWLALQTAILDDKIPLTMALASANANTKLILGFSDGEILPVPFV